MIEEVEENSDKINLPPMPDDAVEFSGLNLMDAVEVEKQATMKNDTLAEFVSEIIDQADMQEAELATTDLDSETPVIINDPTPTEAAPEKEFDPSSTQNALDDFDEEGGARKAVSAGAAALSPAKMIKIDEVDLGDRASDFNPGTVQNALLDNEAEGGIVSNKSTGSMKTKDGDSSNDGGQLREIDKEAEAKMYRVYGFTVQYHGINSANEKIVVTKPISDFFDTEENAMISVNGLKYLMPLKDGSFDVVNIVSGIPQISLGDQNLYTYSGGKIGMGGYWKRS